jgi:hypothetical protein
MQSATVSGITFTYPDTPCMVFNPVPIKVEGSLSRLRVEITDGVNTLAVTYNTPNGGIVDVREYMQGMFTGMVMGGDIDYTQQVKVSEAGKVLTVKLSSLTSAGIANAVHTFTIFAVWGGLQARERYGQHRTVTWFMNYPFTVGVYFPAASNAAIGINSSPQAPIPISAEGVYNLLIDDANGGRYMTIWDIIGTLDPATFEDVFDMTFTYTLNGTQQERIRIKLVTKDIDEGVYLRWIDRHGFWCYWLFKAGNVTRNVGSDGQWHRNDLNDWEETYHWQRTAGRRQTLTRNDVLPVCAPLVDSDTFDWLQDVTTSPCVDMYMGKDENDLPKWTAVTIEAGSYTKDVKKPEQDFVMNVVMPETPIQSL